jgi:hypothetical protein
MNGSTEKRKPPIVLHGAGEQAGASACQRRADRRTRQRAAVAAHWRRRPAVREPANPFSACQENWIDSSHAPGNGNSRTVNRHRDNEHLLDNVVRCTRGIASKQTPCVCMRDPAPPNGILLNSSSSLERGDANVCPMLPQDPLHRFRRRMPTGSARPTRWRVMALLRSRLATMRAAASAYGTIICGIRDANTGRNSGPGRRRTPPSAARLTVTHPTTRANPSTAPASSRDRRRHGHLESRSSIQARVSDFESVTRRPFRLRRDGHQAAIHITFPDLPFTHV